MDTINTTKINTPPTSLQRLGMLRFEKDMNPTRIDQLTNKIVDIMDYMSTFSAPFPPTNEQQNQNNRWIQQFLAKLEEAHALGLKILSNLPKQTQPKPPVIVPNDQLNIPLNPDKPMPNPFPDTTKPITAEEMVKSMPANMTPQVAPHPIDNEPPLSAYNM